MCFLSISCPIMCSSGSKVMPIYSTECDCLQGHSCPRCSLAGSKTRDESELANVLIQAVSKMNVLFKEVTSLQQRFNLHRGQQQENKCERRVSAGRSKRKCKQSKMKANKVKCDNIKVVKSLNSQCIETSSSEDELGLKALDARVEHEQSFIGSVQRKSRSRQDVFFTSTEESSVNEPSDNSFSDTLSKIALTCCGAIFVWLKLTSDNRYTIEASLSG